MAYYYYSNGRPLAEIQKKDHNTLFVSRAGFKDDTIDPRFRTVKSKLKTLVRLITPPILFDNIKQLLK